MSTSTNFEISGGSEVGIQSVQSARTVWQGAGSALDLEGNHGKCFLLWP